MCSRELRLDTAVQHCHHGHNVPTASPPCPHCPSRRAGHPKVAVPQVSAPHMAPCAGVASLCHRLGDIGVPKTPPRGTGGSCAVPEFRGDPTHPVVRPLPNSGNSQFPTAGLPAVPGVTTPVSPSQCHHPGTLFPRGDGDIVTFQRNFWGPWSCWLRRWPQLCPGRSQPCATHSGNGDGDTASNQDLNATKVRRS